MDYIVSGPCEVAGVAPGGTVSKDVLEEHSAIIPALLEGGHLKPAPAPERATEEPTAPAKPKPKPAKDAG